MNENVKKTVYEMLHDRKYNVTELENSYIIAKHNENNEKCLIYFILETKASVKKMKEIKEIVENDNEYKTLIIVYKKNITSFAKQFLLTNLDLHVQVFSENELSFNVTKHEDVPKHVILSTDERNSILKKYKSKLSEFPQMFTSDPVARYYGLKPKTMVRIIRPSPTAGEYTFYRIVV